MTGGGEGTLGFDKTVDSWKQILAKYGPEAKVFEMFLVPNSGFLFCSYHKIDYFSCPFSTILYFGY